jgi:DNA-binding FadR family transcriptional regulator
MSKTVNPKLVFNPALNFDTPPRQAKLGDYLYEQIFSQIASGKLGEGTRLPTESELAKAFKVSRPVVREALSRLRADGVIVSRRGSGSYVQRRPSQEVLRIAPIGTLADLMRCFEFRAALESESAALAAQRRTDRDLIEIEAVLHELDLIIERKELGVEADFRFHSAIAKASKNPLFFDTFNALVSNIFQAINVSRKLSLRVSTERMLIVQNEHTQIFQAIKEENPQKAREAMRKHLDNARTRVLTDSTEPST